MNYLSKLKVTIPMTIDQKRQIGTALGRPGYAATDTEIRKFVNNLFVDHLKSMQEVVVEAPLQVSEAPVTEAPTEVVLEQPKESVSWDCPVCGKSLKTRTNTTTGDEFIGCTGYQDPIPCRYTRTIPKKIEAVQYA